MIETVVDGRLVATVMVNNPGQRNALGNAGKRELAEAIEHVSAVAGLRVVILTGAGDKSFIGGANLKEMPGFVRHAASEGPTLTHRVCEAIRRAPVPVIARVNGWCLGAGLEIAASCDMRAAADTARFGMPEVLFGLPSGMEACLLPQLIGWGKTRELVFTGRHIDCAEAMACHLVERVASPEGLDEAVEDWVAAILKAGPNAIRAQKELVRDWERMSIADAVQQGIRAVAAAHGSDEAKGLMDAFLKRKS
ncbi:enoyl-CoA hydratase-related protein [Acidisphaera sp. S103]|uniref:enoyl-CoA hydratase-related protein n=1 Tax=Acidisphaera sp. S103 TaxID=1747223 RepID=UPI00131D799F|nr:enoyl-CoA hydratase-related protein [Acidisphaera sp. S103]